MATQVEKYPCEITWEAGSLVIIPMNDKANDILATAFASDGSLTTVGITQGDAERGGYADTSTQPYSTLILALS